MADLEIMKRSLEAGLAVLRDVEQAQTDLSRLQRLQSEAERQISASNDRLTAQARTIKANDVKLEEQTRDLGARDARIAALIEQEAGLTDNVKTLNAELDA